MGCDIHGRMEVKIGEQWFAEMEIPTDQDYDVFGILAGVRNYANVKPISEPKGISPDVSDKVQQEIEEWDGHSHSYLTLKEFDEYAWDAV